MKEWLSDVKFNPDDYCTMPEQLARFIRYYILTGILKPGQKLPSAPDIAAYLNIAYKTVHRALSLVEKEGLVIRKRSKGTFVKPFSELSDSLPSSNQTLLLLLTERKKLDYPLNSRVVLGIKETLARYGHKLIIRGSEEFNNWHDAVKELPNLAGILFDKEGFITTEAIDFIKSLKIPSVILNSHPLEYIPNVPVVMPEYVGGAFEATNKLISLGHNNIALFLKSTPGMNALFSDGQKRNGYRNALTANGIKYTEDLLFCKTQNNLESCLANVDKLLKMSERPTAIFCADDIIAYYTIMALRMRKIKVPEQISIVGYYDFEICTMEEPFITTVKTPMFEVGKEGARQLINLMNGNLNSEVTALPTKLYERESVNCKK